MLPPSVWVVPTENRVSTVGRGVVATPGDIGDQEVGADGAVAGDLGERRIGRPTRAMRIA